MLNLLADNNDAGHLDFLVRLIQSHDPDVGQTLDVRLHTFESLQLPRDASDRLLWHTCQRADIILITANRNADGQDSLESIVQLETTNDTLPIITLANPERLMADRQYAEMVAERFLERLFDIEAYRGVGRIFLP